MLSDIQVQNLITATSGRGQADITTRCPACEQSSFSARRDGEGRILWNCFRASCGERGAAWIPGSTLLQEGDKSPIAEKLNPYTGIINALARGGVERFQKRFHLSEGTISAHIFCNVTHYVLPVYDPKGHIRGYTLRTSWWKDEPGPKSRAYKAEAGPWLGWYRPERGGMGQPAILVEDQISAMRIATDSRRLGYAAVALMGVGLNEEKIGELQRNTKHVIIALDKDATGQAFAHARKWRYAFETMRVVVLERDVKDQSPQELYETFR